MKQVVILVAVVALSACAPSVETSSDDGSFLAGTMGSSAPFDAAEVMTGCKFAIRNQLKAPSTARFPGPFSVDFTAPQYVSGANIWVWYVPVDAQNSFGAMIRNRFKCLVRASGAIELTVLN